MRIEPKELQFHLDLYGGRLDPVEVLLYLPDALSLERSDGGSYPLLDILAATMRAKDRALCVFSIRQSLRERPLRAGQM